MTVYTNPVGPMTSWGIRYLVVDSRGEALAAFVFERDLKKYLKENGG